MQCSIIIATYGSDKWKELAANRALPSANRQKNSEIIMVHDYDAMSPAKPRNEAASQANTEWLCFLDADDMLEDNYTTEMLNGSGDLRYPQVRIIKPNHPIGTPYPSPIVIDQCSNHLRERNLLRGNFMVVASFIRKEDFVKVGGFDEYETWEDWALFLKLTYIGAVPKLVPGAVYRVFQHEQSRVSVSNPSKVFLEMKEQFRKWALQYNGGETQNLAYKKFIGGKP